MSLYSLIGPLGMASFGLMAGAVATGLLVRRVKNKRGMLRWHMALGLGALATGVAHALIIFSAY